MEKRLIAGISIIVIGIAAASISLPFLLTSFTTQPSFSRTKPPAVVMNNLPPSSNTGTVSLTWTSIPIATKYELYVSQITFNSITGLIPAATPTTNSYQYQIPATGDHYFGVVAVNVDVKGPLSNIVTTKLESTPIPPTAPVLSVLLTESPDGKISLSWNVVSSATGYKLYRQPTSYTTIVGLEPIKTITGSDASISVILKNNVFTAIDTVTKNGDYYYMVLGFNAIGNGPVSNIVHVVVNAPLITTPPTSILQHIDETSSSRPFYTLTNNPSYVYSVLFNGLTTSIPKCLQRDTVNNRYIVSSTPPIYNAEYHELAISEEQLKTKLNVGYLYTSSGQGCLFYGKVYTGTSEVGYLFIVRLSTSGTSAGPWKWFIVDVINAAGYPDLLTCEMAIYWFAMWYKNGGSLTLPQFEAAGGLFLELT